MKGNGTRPIDRKVNKINPLVKLVGATSGLMILAIAGWPVYLELIGTAVKPSVPKMNQIKNRRRGDDQRRERFHG